jgi:hypothetical protein
LCGYNASKWQPICLSYSKEHGLKAGAVWSIALGVRFSSLARF